MKTVRKLFIIVALALVVSAAFSQVKADSTGWKKTTLRQTGWNTSGHF